MSVEIENSQIKSYGITIMKANADVTAYCKILETINKIPNVTIVDYVFETSDKGLLHVHGVMQYSDALAPLPKKRFRFRNVSIKLVELYDDLGWRSYMTKQTRTPSPNLTPPNSPKFEMPKHSLFRNKQI